MYFYWVSNLKIILREQFRKCVSFFRGGLKKLREKIEKSRKKNFFFLFKSFFSIFIFQETFLLKFFLSKFFLFFSICFKVFLFCFVLFFSGFFFKIFFNVFVFFFTKIFFNLFWKNMKKNKTPLGKTWCLSNHCTLHWLLKNPVF